MGHADARQGMMRASWTISFAITTRGSGQSAYARCSTRKEVRVIQRSTTRSSGRRRDRVRLASMRAASLFCASAVNGGTLPSGGSMISDSFDPLYGQTVLLVPCSLLWGAIN